MHDSTRWLIGWPSETLSVNEVQLWWTILPQSAARLAVLAATLSADEQARAARFRFPEHRDRFIAARGVLRELLSYYLNQPAAVLRFVQGKYGKPALMNTKAGLHFNVSHSENGVLYAIARREVGVDLEHHGRTIRYESIVERICTPEEWVAFQALPSVRRREAFFACWTRKEAIAKALGEGLVSGLSTLPVCFGEEALPEKRAVVRDKKGRQWSVLSLPMEKGWNAALAGRGTDWQWNARRLPDGDAVR